MSDITSWGTNNTGIDERIKYFSNPAFVRNQPVYPGACEFVHELCKKAEVVIATNVPAQCAGVRINAIVENFPEISVSNILIGARKDLLKADMMLDDAPQNLDGANARYPVLFRQPWNYGKTGLLSVSTYSEFLTLVDMIRSNEMTTFNAEAPAQAIVLIGPSGVNNTHFENIQDDFFETSSYMGHRYGTKLTNVQCIIDDGHIPLLIMDINGMVAMKSHFRTLSVFVKASKEQCIRNIFRRGCTEKGKVRRIASLDTELLSQLLGY